MKLQRIIACFIALFLIACNGIDQKYIDGIAAHRTSLNHTFFNAQTTPLDTNKLKAFTGLHFFEINQDYKVKATLTKYADMPSFELPHSHNATKPYKQYGELTFTLKGTDYKLTVLEAVNKKEAYKNYLLVCFTDLTTGKETYGAGRYIDIEIPKSNLVDIDFNLAYFPYCAYNSSYTCPIPPKENFINYKIEAGEKL
ncbi:MAG: DUF1684 domain-containing protein [Bacteroidota bacterium]